MLRQACEHRLAVVLADIGRNASQELVAADGLRHALDVAADELHGIAAIGAEQAVAIVALGGAAVDDGNEVRGDDDAVLAFALWVLGDEGLFDDLHDRDRVRE